jgi:hypothetical protein
MPKLSRLLLAQIACLSLAPAAQAATTLTLEGCDVSECHNLGLTLSVADQGDGSWLVTYTIDTTAYDDSFVGLNQLGFKTIQGYSTAELISASNDVANWSDAVEAPVNSNGGLCSPAGNTSKVCIAAENQLLDLRVNGVYEWKFEVVGGKMLDTSQWHFGGQLANQVGPAKGHIISQGAPPIPEPSAALLFAVGALTVGRSLRRPLRHAQA